MKIKHPITIAQASRRCEVNELTIWRLIRQGEIHSGINFGEVVVNAEELQQFAQQNPRVMEFWKMKPEKRFKILYPNGSWNLDA